MNNEELKKKIKEILRKRMTELLGSCHTDEIPLTEEGAEAILFYADEFADALIAAGIGDLKEHRIFAGKDGSIKQLYSGEEVEKIVKERKELKDELRSKVEYIHEQDEVIKEYKHRAEVAERALDKATELAYTYRTENDTLSCSSCSFFDSIFDRCKERGLYEDCSKRWKEELLQQAEKELAEEMKDD